jgi:predicted transcriptional regulator
MMIVDLSKSVAILQERLDNERSELKRVDAERLKSAEQFGEIARRLAIIEENVKEFKKIAEERDRRRWTVILAVVGCLLTLAANIGLTYLRLNK